MKTFLCLLFWPLVALQADELVRHEWKVDGVVREALVYAPSDATNEPTPVIFVFHGHGGTMANAARSFQSDMLWPGALVIYPQGLNAPGKIIDPEGKKSGWQFAAGDQGDRDLKFFDAILASLKHDYKVDPKRLYATGHSNGGSFTYLLWAERGDLFAAFAPSGSIAGPLLLRLKPKPVLHVAGENDAVVKFEWQKKTMDALRQLNQCGAGQPWGEEKLCTCYPSKIGAPVVTFIHPGDHPLPAEAPLAIVKFFQQQAKP